MADGYVRQTIMNDGDTIVAQLFNDEFDTLDATFDATGGHSHDGTAGNGGPIAASSIAGLTASVTELNVLDGIPATLTATELGYVDGVTSSIQTQINTKAPTASPTFTGVPAAPTATAGTSTTQVATTAFVTGAITDLVDGAPGVLDTLNELAAALGDDASFSTTVTTALGNRLRVDTNAQGLNGTQQQNALTNLGITPTLTEINYVDGVTSAIQTQIDTKLASASYTAADVLSKVLTVDGSGSGLDADLLDGNSSAYYQQALVSNTNIKTVNGTSLLGSGDVGVGVTSVAASVPTGLVVTGSPVTTTGTLAIAYDTGYAIPTTAKQTEWDTAYTDRNKWDGGATGLTAATGRTSLGGTTVGQAVFTLVNPSAITFPRINADNTVTALNASDFRTAIGAGSGGGDVSGPASSVDNEVVLFDSTTGKVIKRASTTGIAKLTSGVLSAATAGTDYVTPTGTETLTNKTVETPAFTKGYTETVYALSGTAFAATNGSIQTKTLSGNTTFTSSLSSGQSIVLLLEAGASYTVTWPTTTWVSSAGNVAPTLTAKDTLVFFYIGSTLYGVYVGSYV